MRIGFRQGIVDYPEVGGTGQAFLQVTGGGTDVNILTGSGFTTIAFAQRTANYIHVETNPVTSPSAWTGLPATVGTNAWLFWDIDAQTGVVSYGFTLVQPTSGSVQPGTASPIVTPLVTDQHWFDTNENTMKVYDGARFLEKIRVFAARINGSTLTPLGSNAAKPYAGTQVGIVSATNAGQILFSQGVPVTISIPGVSSPTALNPFARNFIFATTETEFLVGGSQTITNIRLESDVTTAQASINMSAFDVVKYSTFGVITPADYNDTETTTIGIIVDDVLLGEIATVVIQGSVINEAWNWPTVGAELWILSNGTLTDSDPNLTNPSLYPTSKVPVARVLSRTEIVFMQGLGKVGPRGAAGILENPASLNSVGDVTIVSAAEDEILKYSGSPLMWRNVVVNSLLVANNLLDLDNIATARVNLDVDISGTDNSTNVTLAGTPNYITISGQVITRNAIDLATDVTNDLAVADGGTGSSSAAGARTNLDVPGLSTANTFTNARSLVVSATSPNLGLIETDVAVDNRNWRINAQGGVLRFEAENDAQSSAVTFMEVQRTATVIDSIALEGGDLNMNIVGGSPIGSPDGRFIINYIGGSPEPGGVVASFSATRIRLHTNRRLQLSVAGFGSVNAHAATNDNGSLVQFNLASQNSASRGSLGYNGDNIRRSLGLPVVLPIVANVINLGLPADGPTIGLPFCI